MKLLLVQTKEGPAESGKYVDVVSSSRVRFGHLIVDLLLACVEEESIQLQ